MYIETHLRDDCIRCVSWVSATALIHMAEWTKGNTVTKERKGNYATRLVPPQSISCLWWQTLSAADWTATAPLVASANLKG